MPGTSEVQCRVRWQGCHCRRSPPLASLISGEIQPGPCPRSLHAVLAGCPRSFPLPPLPRPRLRLSWGASLRSPRLACVPVPGWVSHPLPSPPPLPCSLIGPWLWAQGQALPLCPSSPLKEPPVDLGLSLGLLEPARLKKRQKVDRACGPSGFPAFPWPLRLLAAPRGPWAQPSFPESPKSGSAQGPPSLLSTLPGSRKPSPQQGFPPAGLLVP